MLSPIATEESEMSPMKIMAEQNNGDEALWNTRQDRWSRRAKHQLNLTNKGEISENIWNKGDKALYENQEVTVVIPAGPNFTVGIMLEGKTRMVRETMLYKIDEGVMGGMKPLSPINRIMQLAGLSVPTIMEPTSESIDLVDTENVDPPVVVNEADATNMFEQLFDANFNGQYKNNPAAARLATIGQILTGIEPQVTQLADQIPQDLSQKITAVVGLGALIMQSANAMLKPSTTTATGAPPTNITTGE